MAHGKLDGDTFVKSENEKDKMRMAGGSWSINLKDLPEEAEHIEYRTPQFTYRIAREKAFRVGFEREFDTADGPEVKLVVPERYWSKLERSSTDDTEKS